MVDDVYKLNGTEVCPTEFQWLPRSVLGIQGDGRPIYQGTRSAQLTWEMTTYEEWAEAQVAYNAVQSTGTIVAQIPAFPTGVSSALIFTEYSGVIISEPEVGALFADNPSSLVLVVSNIPAG